MNDKPRVNMEIRAGGAPPEIVMSCDTFWRCLDCGMTAGGPAGFSMTHCACGGETFAEVTMADMLAQQGPCN